MNKKSEKQSGIPKKIYNSPKLGIHGVISDITKSGPNPPSYPDDYGCSG